MFSFDIKYSMSDIHWHFIYYYALNFDVENNIIWRKSEPELENLKNLKNKNQNQINS